MPIFRPVSRARSSSLRTVRSTSSARAPSSGHCSHICSRCTHERVGDRRAGAYPGAGAEERGIAAAIANAIMEWFRIPVPIVAAVIGEGGSGGALGMGVADRVIMLENSIYSVASPEAAASIVWRDNSRKVEAAEQLQLTSREIVGMGVVEEVVPEPKGSASADYDAAARALDDALYRHMKPLLDEPSSQLLQHRYDRFRYIDSLIRAEPHFGPKID